MKKMLASALLALGMLASTVGVAQAELVNVKIKVELTLDSNLVRGYADGEFLGYDSVDVKPFLYNGSTMVPLRYLADMLMFDVEWDEKTQTVTLYDPDHIVVLPVGAKEATVNWQKMKLNAPAIVKDGRTFVPVRFITEALGGQIGWDPVNSVVSVEKMLEIETSDEEEYTEEDYIDPDEAGTKADEYWSEEDDVYEEDYLDLDEAGTKADDYQFEEEYWDEEDYIDYDEAATKADEYEFDEDYLYEY